MPVPVINLKAIQNLFSLAGELTKVWPKTVQGYHSLPVNHGDMNFQIVCFFCVLKFQTMNMC